MSNLTIGPTVPDPMLKGASELTPLGQSTQVGGHNPLDAFGDMLAKQVSAVDGDMKSADQLTESFLRGGETSIHEVMIATSKADISFRLMTQVGRKVVEAYQEIMRMQV